MERAVGSDLSVLRRGRLVGLSVEPGAGLSHLPNKLQRQPEPKPNKFEAGLVIDLVRETVTPY